MSDMEKVIEKALLAASVDDQGVPDIDDQVRLVAQALTASGYGVFGVVRSEASQPVLPGELVEAVEFAIRFAEGIAKFRDDGDECVASDVARRLRAAVANLPDPLPTVESVRADERERLAPHLHTAIAVITEMLEREGISDPETFPPLVEIRAAWLRSQKNTTHDQ